MILLEVKLPFASFLEPHSREYLTSFPVPPPSTIYGFILSLIGEFNKRKYSEVKLAVGFHQMPKTALLLRTCKRFKTKDIASPKNSRPDYQEVLCNLHLFVGVKNNELEEVIERSLLNPASCSRFGGLSLGESRDLVDEINILEQPPEKNWLVPSDRGHLSLPTNVDYDDESKSSWLRFSFGTFSEDNFFSVV